MYLLFILVLFIFTLPIQLVISVCILLTSGFPILFLQRRTGRNGKTFTLYKFRTMIVGSEHEQQRYTRLNEANGPVFKIRNDPRYTLFGKFLSHTGLDELPQLVNIINGDMALFGPRPLPVYEAKKLLKWQRERHSIKPGILSPWVLDGYHKKRFDDWMRNDLSYVKNKSFMYDLKLFVRSIFFMLRLLYQEIVL
jgi:lipopolysaccharide/colanic/teichoic acid biosynthesis glycosyltransferase